MNTFHAPLRLRRAVAASAELPPIQGLERRFRLLNLSVSDAGVECSLLIDPRR